MAQQKVWEDYDYESDTDVQYDFDSEEDDAEEEDKGKNVGAGRSRRDFPIEEFPTHTARKRRKYSIEVEPRERRKPIPKEEPRKTRKIEEEQHTKTENKTEKMVEDEGKDYEEADKVEEIHEDNNGEKYYEEVDTDEEIDEDEDSEEFDYEEYYGEEYIIRPEELEGPYPNEMMTEKERDALAEEIATMLGATDGTPDPDVFMPLDCTDGIEIGDERWKALMKQIIHVSPYEEHMPKHNKTPAELIWEAWDRMDYNEGRYVDPEEFDDNDLSVPKDIDMEEVKKLATMIEEGKPLPDYYQ